MIKGETKSPRHLPRALWEEVGISRRVHPEGLTEFEIQRRYYAKLDKELKGKDRIHLMNVLDKIDELELDKNVLNLDDIVSVISDVKYNLILQKCNYISVSLDNEILKRDEKIEILKHWKDRKIEPLNH